MNRHEALLCDAVLEKFRGNQQYSRKDVVAENFYNPIDEDFDTVDMAIQYLLANDYLHYLWDMSRQRHMYQLSPKGKYALTDINRKGVIAKWESDDSAKVNARRTQNYALWAVIISVLAILVTLGIEAFRYYNEK